MKRTITLSTLEEIAKKNSGKLLSEKYINAKTKYTWECSCGYIWNARFHYLEEGHWCPKCSGRTSYSIEELNEFAAKKGGKIISTKYINSQTNYTWECIKKHRWKCRYQQIKVGHWCPKCYSERVQPTIENMHQWAEERGGKCLSEKYVLSATKLEWECANGHKFKSTPNNIQQGGWCPICSSGIGERITRAHFEQIFKLKFKRTRPGWLINLEGHKLELDGYCKKLNIAFEHQGTQHYKKRKYFYKTNEEFEKRLRDDELKKKICKKEGIILFDIPEVPRLTNFTQLKELIKKISLENNIKLPKNYNDLEIDLSDCYTPDDILEELKLLAKEKNGKLLSKEYRGWDEPLEWECSEKHKFKLLPRAFKYQNSWCSTCLFNKKAEKVAPIYYKRLQEFVKSKKGNLLSKQYLGAHKKLLFECKEGHQWESSPSNIYLHGKWCPYCMGQVKGTIEDMRIIAKEQGGICLSNKYIGRHEYLKWQCSKGHIWDSTPASIINKKSWCPKCKGVKKLTIADMHNDAKNNNGKCLSKKYINVKTKLLWQCSEGHQWYAKPNNIRNGTWCPSCAYRK